MLRTQMPGPVSMQTVRSRLENRRNRPQAGREPEPGAPACGGAGAPLAGRRPGSGM